MTSLNPLFPVGFQVAEVLEEHLGLGRREALARAVELFRDVGIPDPERRVRDYPHQLSGGMRQRVMIAMAMACRPAAPDRRRAHDRARRHHPGADPRAPAGPRPGRGTAVLLISHDLGVVAAMASRVVVMYAGQVVEEAPARELFAAAAAPLHAAAPGRGPRGPREAGAAVGDRGEHPGPVGACPSGAASIPAAPTRSRSAARPPPHARAARPGPPRPLLARRRGRVRLDFQTDLDRSSGAG